MEARGINRSAIQAGARSTAEEAGRALDAVPLRFFGVPRPLEVIAWVGATLLFAALALWVTAGSATGLDLAVLAWLQQSKSESLDRVAHVLSLFGSELLGVVHLILLAILLRRRRWELAFGLFLATAGAGLLNGLIKDLFERTRPAEVYGLLPPTGGQVYSFPSGHAMVTAAFFYFLSYVSCPFLAGWRRSGWIVGLVLVAVVIGLARTYLGAHWLTDVVAGYLIGFVWAQTVILGAHLVARKQGGHRVCGCPGECKRHRMGERGGLTATDC